MADEIKDLKSSIESSVEALKLSWKERQDIQDKTGKELGEKIEKTHKIVDDLKASLDAIEKKNKEQEQAIARMGSQADGEKSVSQVELKKFNEMLKSYSPNQSGRQISAENAKSLADIQEKYLRFGDRTGQMTHDELKSINSVVDPEGGYFIMPQWGAMDAAKGFDANGILSVVRRQACNSGMFSDIIDWADYDLSYYQAQLTENATVQAGEAFKKFNLVISTQKYGKKFTREMLEDSGTDIQGKVIRRMQEGMDRTKAQMLVNGTISQDKPRGILTYAHGTTYGTVQQVDGITSQVIGWDDVLNGLPSALKEKYRANASYLMAKGTFFKLLTEKDGVQRYQVSDMINFFSGDAVKISILGTPVVYEPNMPAVGSGNPLSVAYGDFNEAYVLAERLGYSIIRDETHPDYIQLWIRNRHMGGVFNFEAYKILKIKS